MTNLHSEATVHRALELVRRGAPIAAVAEQLGVSTKTVRRWHSQYVISGGSRFGSRPRAPCPACDGTVDASAYAYLLGLYLGDGHIAIGRRDVYRLDIACADAWPGLIDEAVAAMSRVLSGRVPGRRQSIGCVYVYAYWKHWPCAIPQHGPGRKHDREIRLESWQAEIVEQHTEDLLRGLFHSDGCRITNRVRRCLKSGERWYAYPRYFFANESRDILQICGDGLDRLGIAWRYSRPNTISVARREAVAALDRFVGPKF